MNNVNIEHLDRAAPLTVVYHDPCMDGAASAFAVKQRFPERPISFIKAQYGDDSLNQIKADFNADLLIVDFSYKKDDILALTEKFKTVTVFDHHEKSKDDLEDLLKDGSIHGVFDMSKSGAMLTWESLFPNKPAPEIFKYVEDRDLFRFKYKETMAISLASALRGFGLENFEDTFEVPFEQLLADGNSILEFSKWSLHDTINDTLFYMNIRDHIIPVVNGTHPLRSDICAELYNRDSVPFALSYSLNGPEVGLSFRSKRGEGIDVNELATTNEWGGGHKHAAGGRADFITDLGGVVGIPSSEMFDTTKPTITPVIQRFIDGTARELSNTAFLMEDKKGFVVTVNTPRCHEETVVKQLAEKYQGIDRIIAIQGVASANVRVNEFNVSGSEPKLDSSKVVSKISDVGFIIDKSESKQWFDDHKPSAKPKSPAKGGNEGGLKPASDENEHSLG